MHSRSSPLKQVPLHQLLGNVISQNVLIKWFVWTPYTLHAYRLKIIAEAMCVSRCRCTSSWATRAYTLNPTPCTLNPTPYTLNPKP